MRTWLGQGCLDSLIRALPWGKGGAFLPRDVLIGHSWQGLGLDFQYLSGSSEAGFGVPEGPLSDWGAHNLDRFRRLLEGGIGSLTGPNVWLPGGGDMRRGFGVSAAPSDPFC